MNKEVNLYLAPMEGLGDRAFRIAMATIGGFDEACTEFMRVPKNAHCPSLARKYDPTETSPIPLAAQVMGYDLDLVPKMAMELERRGAPRIDLNCGCPSNTVTGRGAGSSLLKEPDHIHRLVRAISDAVSIPVTVKMRSGFLDTALFEENLLAAEKGGAQFITLHPRTKAEGYTPPANWDLIRRAKEVLSIPLVGNGDILTTADADRMLEETGCDALMIGRGAAMNPWIFQEIRAHWRGESSPKTDEGTEHFYRTYFRELQEMKERTQINKLKQMISYHFRSEEHLLERRSELLKSRPENPEQFLETLLSHLIPLACLSSS